jgi:hypothetical protein
MSFFHDLNNKLKNIAATALPSQINERDEGKHNNATTGFRAVADKAAETYGSKAAGQRVAGAVRNKMKAAGKLEEVGDTPAGQEKLAQVKSRAEKRAFNDRSATDSDYAFKQRAANVRSSSRMNNQPIEEYGMEEGNAFSGAVAKAKQDGIQPGEKINVGGKVFPVKETGMPMTAKQKSFAALAEPKDKITFADKIAGAKSEVDEMLGDVAAEAMKSAIGKMHGQRNVVDETDDENAFTAHKRPRAEVPKVGTVTHGVKHDVEEIPGGRRVTRRTDSAGMSVGSGDGSGPSTEVRGRGRPKGPEKAPERVTAKAYKHKGERKVKEGEVSTGNLQQMWRLVTGLKTFVQDPDGQALLKELTGMVKHYVNQGGEQELDEKAVSKKQQRFMGMVHATQKGEKAPSKEVAKVAKEMPKKAAKDFASTKQKGLPEKVKEEGKDSPKEDKPKKAKGGYAFGGSVYEALDAQLETLITEGMSVTISMNQSEGGQGGKNISIQADGDDADRLAELLKMSGMSAKKEVCPGCGQADCGCDEMVDENSPDWPTNQETSNDALQYSGGLNKPKSTGQSTTPVLASQLRRQVSMEESVKIEHNLFDLYKNFKAK